MSRLKKILVLNNEVEASLIEDILNEREIPFNIETYYSQAYDGIFQMSRGWGYIESEEKYAEKILSIYNEIKES